ncbi:NAC domain-containing protein 26-like [Lolium rigidum]|uniref:NAC domain-containing protein 26-like n=1 Tax=Lolium rigidum TaxID=89674 RepID=UPI001F5D4D39|nr:NAC domain-containing protein 26-like [Lolium rigidum]
MAKKDGKAVTKKRSYAAANASGSGSSLAMAVMPPPHGANHIQLPPPLPPGVYFSPTREECLGFLNRSIAGDNELADARGYIFRANLYGESPDALRRRHPPASIRGRSEDVWWFLSQTRFQSQTVGGGASKRADRQVKTGGFWRLEQGKEELKKSKKRMEEEEDEEDADGVKNSFGFYVGKSKKDDKTPWLMQEFTSANDDGTGKLGMPALYRVYVSPRAGDDRLREVFGEDGAKKEPDGKTKRPARVMVPQEYFDRIAALLPEGSVRGVVQEHIQAPPPVTPVGLPNFHGQHGHYLGQYYNQQQGQYLGQYKQQQGQYLGKYEQQEGSFSGPSDYYGQHGQYLGQLEQQQWQYLAQYQQQQEPPLSVVAPPPASLGLLGEIKAEAPSENLSMPMVAPPASPGLLGELKAEAPSDNLSMPMDEFLSMINEQPEVAVKGEEQIWESLPDILDADEVAKFSK